MTPGFSITSATRQPPRPALAAHPRLNRRHWCLGTAAALGLGACSTPGPSPVTPAAPGRGNVVPFSASRRLGELPDGWQQYINRPDLPRTVYELTRQDDRLAVHAIATSSTSGLRCDVDIDPHQLPWLGWEWRVDRCPPEATVAEDELDDSPARVVLAFEGNQRLLSLRDRLFAEQVELFTGHTMPFATLVYAWDGQAPLDSVFRYARSSRIRTLVVERGEAGIGRWQAYRRNVLADYRRVYGTEPGRITSVGVLTDSDDLKVRLEAWFGDLAFS